jgi:hypothetical protein
MFAWERYYKLITLGCDVGFIELEVTGCEGRVHGDIIVMEDGALS